MIVDQLEQVWNQVLEISAVFVTPNWGDPVSWLPVLLLVGVVGPILTLTFLGWVLYLARRPRLRVGFPEVRRPATAAADGSPVFPAGEPYSPAERMIYEPGATRSASGDPLLVGCPKCGLVRPADVDACGNCGMAFSLRPAARSLRAPGPPPGGAAAA